MLFVLITIYALLFRENLID